MKGQPVLRGQAPTHKMAEPMTRKPVTVAMYQGACAKLGKVQKNLEKMKQQMVLAKKMGADVIVFPELFTSGYMLSNDRMKELAEVKNGKSFLDLSDYAKENEIGVLYGYPELNEANGHVYNSAQFIDKNGASLSNYQKTHLWIDSTNVEKVFTAGETFAEIFEFCGMKVGLLICYDVEFCEAVRILALRGAEAVLVPTACPEHYFMDFLIASRAYENSIYVVYVNHCGGGFAGKSVCCGPMGRALYVWEPRRKGFFLQLCRKN